MEDPVSESSFEYLNDLPEQIVLGAEDFKILATHFIEPDITGTSKRSPSGPKDFSSHLKLLKRSKTKHFLRFLFLNKKTEYLLVI